MSDRQTYQPSRDPAPELRTTPEDVVERVERRARLLFLGEDLERLQNAVWASLHAERILTAAEIGTLSQLAGTVQAIQDRITKELLT